MDKNSKLTFGDEGSVERALWDFLLGHTTETPFEYIHRRNFQKLRMPKIKHENRN